MEDQALSAFLASIDAYLEALKKQPAGFRALLQAGVNLFANAEIEDAELRTEIHKILDVLRSLQHNCLQESVYLSESLRAIEKRLHTIEPKELDDPSLDLENKTV